MKYKLIDHGIEHSQYLIPNGTIFTEFNSSAIGFGDTFQEAIDDALESIATLEPNIAEKLEKEIKADYAKELAKESPSAYQEADFESELHYYIEILY